MQILTLSRAICSDIFHSLSAPATLDGAQGSPGLGTALAQWPGPEPPSRQGAASESSPGFSASPLRFEIEFGLRKGGYSPPYHRSISQAGSGPPNPALHRQNWWAWAKGSRMAEGSIEVVKTLRVIVRELGYTWHSLCVLPSGQPTRMGGDWGDRQVVRSTGGMELA